MTTRADRKRAELRAKLRTLSDEFTAWTEATGDQGPLPRHHSQVEAVVRALSATLATVAPAADADDAALLATWAGAEEDLLAVHEIWGYFREKFALRYVTAFEPYLRMADDFAYACYRPAQERARDASADELKAPPLVFLGQVATPYALARGASYASQVNPAVLSRADFRTVIDTLPIPMVGVPWFQLRHLPDALVIGHEVGHHVAHDFRLDATLRDLLNRAGLPADRRAAWRRWLPEVFADVYGVLAAGPAFVGALADFVPTGPLAAAGTKGYPPAGIRIRVAAEVSAATRPAAEPADPEDVLGRWRADFADDGSAFHDDVPKVAGALLAGPYPEFGGASLTDVLSFAGRRASAAAHASALLAEDSLDLGIDVRVLLAAGALAFVRDPAGYESRKAQERVLAHAAKIEAKGLRATTLTGTPAARDEAAGAAVAGLLARRRKSQAPVISGP